MNPTNEHKRLEIRRRCDTQLRTGGMGMWKIYITDEKLFRLGAFRGGNNNLFVYVKKELKKRPRPNSVAFFIPFMGGSQI